MLRVPGCGEMAQSSFILGVLLDAPDAPGPGIRLSPSGYGQALSCLLLSFRHLLLQSLEGFPGPGVRSARASVVGGFGPSRPSCDDSRPSPGLPFLQGLRGSEPGRKVPRGLGDRRGHGVPGSTEQSLRGCFLSRLARGTRAKRAEDRHARFWGFLRSTCILSPWFCRSRAQGPLIFLVHTSLSSKAFRSP